MYHITGGSGYVQFNPWCQDDGIGGVCCALYFGLSVILGGKSKVQAFSAYPNALQNGCLY